MTIGERIKMVRIQKGLSQKKLGERCIPPIHDVQIRKYERGEVTPKMETVIRIAEGLEIPPVELAGPEWESLNYEARTQHYPPFLQYLGSLGYKVFGDSSPEPLGNVTIQRPNGGYILITPEGKEIFFTGDQFKAFEKAIADSVEYQLWQQIKRR